MAQKMRNVIQVTLKWLFFCEKIYDTLELYRFAQQKPNKAIY